MTAIFNKWISAILGGACITIDFSLVFSEKACTFAALKDAAYTGWRCTI
jgi:hypothetical protein